MAETTPVGPSYHAVLYQDEAKEWRWRLVAENGQVVGTSGEGYVERTHAKKMLRQLFSPGRITIVDESGIEDTED